MIIGYLLSDKEGLVLKYTSQPSHPITRPNTRTVYPTIVVVKLQLPLLFAGGGGGGGLVLNYTSTSRPY